MSETMYTQARRRHAEARMMLSVLSDAELPGREDQRHRLLQHEPRAFGVSEARCVEDQVPWPCPQFVEVERAIVAAYGTDPVSGTLHNPWDQRCSRRCFGEPTVEAARCPVCRDISAEDRVTLYGPTAAAMEAVQGQHLVIARKQAEEAQASTPPHALNLQTMASPLLTIVSPATGKMLLQIHASGRVDIEMDDAPEAARVFANHLSQHLVAMRP